MCQTLDSSEIIFVHQYKITHVLLINYKYQNALLVLWWINQHRTFIGWFIVVVLCIISLWKKVTAEMYPKRLPLTNSHTIFIYI